MVLKATIETARPYDFAETLAFLRAAADNTLLPRPDIDYVRSIGLGLFCHARVEGRLVAVAGAFPLSQSGQHLVEMGSCFVVPAYRGFGLQKMFVRARIASVAAFVDPDARILTGVKPDNLRSRSSVLKAGFEPLKEDASLLTELCAYCLARPGETSDRLCCCDFFYIPRHRQLQEITTLLDHATTTVVRPNGEQLAVRVAIDALTGPARARLEALVAAPALPGEASLRS